MYKKMLIPLDGSKVAEQVLPYARAVASKLRMPVDLLGVVDVVEVAAHAPAEKAYLFESMIASAERNMAEYLGKVALTFPGLAVQHKLEKGTPADVIIETAAAENGTLIAMATHGRSGLNRWMLGSVAEKVLRGTSNPLLLVRAGEEAVSRDTVQLTAVIVPLDGSELAEMVLPPVIELAAKLDLEMMLFRAFNIPYGVYAGADGYFAINFDQLIADMKAEATEYLEKKAEELRQKGVRNVSILTREGLSADEIISLGRNTPENLIAMCSHGRSGIKRWVLGSVTETVVRHSGDPVLVVPAR